MSVEKVLAVMSASDKPLTAGKIAELAGLDKKVVEKAMNELKKTGKNCFSSSLCLGSEKIDRKSVV